MAGNYKGYRRIGMKGIKALPGYLRAHSSISCLILSVIVGVGGGFGAVAFRWLIGAFHRIFFDDMVGSLSVLGNYAVILAPVVGGLIVGCIIYFTRTGETKGHGVPEVMEAVWRHGGRIRPRVAAVKVLASSICLGSGGSAGREGPIVQIGSSIGSSLAQWFRLPDEWVKTLVACGAAAGISATFNAPIGGIFFALEVILGRVLSPRLNFVVVSSVVADVIAHIFLGDFRAFSVPAEYTLNNYGELPLYILLGLFAGLIAVLFTRSLYKIEDVFDALKMPEYLKPALGGLAIGIMGYCYPYLFGVGYDGIDQALAGNIAISSLAALLFLKILATSFTLGSGGSGGIFAPSLFMGAMLGGLFGEAAHGFLPGVVGPSGAYALVGMAAVSAGTTWAPITSFLILFEMTGNYAIILPLLLSVVASTLLAHRLSHESIYTLKLARRGVSIQRPEEAAFLSNITVGEVMTRHFPTMLAQKSVPELVEKLNKTGHHGLPVIDGEGCLYGMVTLSDVESRIADSKASGKITVADICTRHLITAYPDQPLSEVVGHLGVGTSEIPRIPVVSREDATHLLGVLRRQDIIKGYARAITKVHGSDE
ncbi:MAG: chloride channel protein [Dehalococcoidia bacterium]|nr:chloride channel protein [Dehalococcoidia bacterium]